MLLEENLLLEEQILLFKRIDPIEKEGKNKNGRVAAHESVSIDLNTFSGEQEADRCPCIDGCSATGGSYGAYQ